MMILNMSMLQKTYGITAVLVKNKGTEHIHKAFNFLYEFNEQHEIYVELEEPATENLCLVMKRVLI
ncbi:hypothetical protein [Rickettsia massiliae]|uniref:hypothetical protein n=1 Tax=Rickettsia massiliae TaxID=35791 RepID=UPI0018861B24|nr:hypothetical protein [Rickettsia massiliae]